MPYYEINVAKDGNHHFATAERSLTDEVKAKSMYSQFCKLFPESEGYTITVCYRENVGRYLKWPFDPEQPQE
jgi:hypothetical protein